jgi:hypothetical protein
MPVPFVDEHYSARQQTNEQVIQQRADAGCSQSIQAEFQERAQYKHGKSQNKAGSGGSKQR